MVMVVYDVTSEQSFSSCAKWLERVKVQRPGAEVPLPGERCGAEPVRGCFTVGLTA